MNELLLANPLYTDVCHYGASVAFLNIFIHAEQIPSILLCSRGLYVLQITADLLLSYGGSPDSN